jgi:hypothetical protein
MAEEFENLIDSLIYHLIAYSELEQKEESKLNVNKLREMQQVSNSAFDLLTFLVGLSPFNPDCAPNPNSAPTHLGQKSIINMQHYFDKVSSNEAPKTVREKLVMAVLQTYSP